MIAFGGQVWRILPAGDGARADKPGRNPEGRFHHSGQVAIYTSLTQEGAGVAIRRYLRDGDPPRIIVPLTIRASRITDLRATGSAPSVVWQDLRAAGAPAPTWTFSDRAREAGAEGMLYRSRSRPELTHLVLFDAAAITGIGKPVPWTPESLPPLA